MPRHFEHPEAAEIGKDAASAKNQDETRLFNAFAERADGQSVNEKRLDNLDKSKESANVEKQETGEEIIAQTQSELSMITRAEKDLLAEIAPEALEHFEDQVYELGEEWIDRLRHDDDPGGFTEALQELRTKFVEEWIQDATAEMLDHFNSSFQGATNGPKAAELLKLKMHHTLTEWLEEYVKTGDPSDFTEIEVQIQIAKYPMGNEEKKFITDIEIIEDDGKRTTSHLGNASGTVTTKEIDNSK